eukprot:4850491-Pyramimonas_sp.AAC.1
MWEGVLSAVSPGFFHIFCRRGRGGEETEVGSEEDQEEEDDEEDNGGDGDGRGTGEGACGGPPPCALR